MLDVKVIGSEDLRRVAKTIRQRGAKEIQKEMLKGIRDATKQVGQEVRKDLPSHLPDRYAQVLGKALRFTTRTKTSGWPEITVTARAKGKVQPRAIAAINRGTLRHPLYGNRKHWYAQRVTPKFFDTPAERVLRDVQRAAAKAVERAAAQLEREL